MVQSAGMADGGRLLKTPGLYQQSLESFGQGQWSKGWTARVMAQGSHTIRRLARIGWSNCEGWLAFRGRRPSLTPAKLPFGVQRDNTNQDPRSRGPYAMVQTQTRNKWSEGLFAVALMRFPHSRRATRFGRDLWPENSRTLANAAFCR